MKSNKLRVAAAAFGGIVLASCTSTGTTSSINTTTHEAARTSTYEPGSSRLDQSRHNYVACLLETRSDASCTSQRTRFADAVRASAFKHPSTLPSHRQARNNQDFIDLTVERALSRTRRLALR